MMSTAGRVCGGSTTPGRSRAGWNDPADTRKGTTVNDVKVERKESLSRQEAAQWLSALSKAFSRGGEVTLPLGTGTISLNLPEQVAAEFEVEVDGDEVEIEVEFTWSTASRSSGDDVPAHEAPSD